MLSLTNENIGAFVAPVRGSSAVSDVPASSVLASDGSSRPVLSPVEQASLDLERVRSLQGRIRQMQRTTIEDSTLSVLPPLAELFPGGALRAGAAYSVAGSTSLLMALLAGPSAQGAWCAVVGMPEFGVEAAERFGIDLEHLVFVPRPAEHWLAVTAALADAVSIVVTRPPTRSGTRSGSGIVTDADAARLGARLRQRGSVLLTAGGWPRSEAVLSIENSEWAGLGNGYGRLESRRVTITADARNGGTVRRARLLLPDARDGLRAERPPEPSRTALPWEGESAESLAAAAALSAVPMPSEEEPDGTASLEEMPLEAAG